MPARMSSLGFFWATPCQATKRFPTRTVQIAPMALTAALGVGATLATHPTAWSID